MGRCCCRLPLILAPTGFTPQSLGVRFGLDVRVRTEVLAVDRTAKRVRVRDLDTGTEYDETYDDLILSTGASPVVPPAPGVHRALTLRTVEDVDALVGRLDAGARSVVVVGGGFVGLETAEDLHRRGLQVTLVERTPQVLTPLDAEMVAPVHAELRRQGIDLELSAELVEVTDDAVLLAEGRRLPADVVVLAIGVRPDSGLARAAGLEVDERGGMSSTTSSAPATRPSTPSATPRRSGTPSTGRPPSCRWPTSPPCGAPGRGCHRGPRRPGDRVAGRCRRQSLRLHLRVTGWNERRARAAGLEVEVIHTHPPPTPVTTPGPSRWR